MRWNAQGIVDAAQRERIPLPDSAIRYAARVAADTTLLAVSSADWASEQALAAAAATIAMRRHGRPGHPSEQPRPLADVQLVLGSVGSCATPRMRSRPVSSLPSRRTTPEVGGCRPMRGPASTRHTSSSPWACWRGRIRWQPSCWRRGSSPRTSLRTMDSDVTVTIADIRAAREVLSKVIRPTPLKFNRALSERVGADVFLKCENLQRAGSFKIRGAYTRMSRLSPQEQAAGVVAASAGNHAQGVALAAQMLGIASKVYMPRAGADAQAGRDACLRRRGRAGGETLDESLLAACAWADETGAILIHPFDHADIVAGQGTCGWEILDQCPDVRTVVVGLGGGGLLAGIATVMRAQAGRSRHRGAGRAGRGIPRFPGRRSPGQGRSDGDDGRWHRRGVARRRHLPDRA